MELRLKEMRKARQLSQRELAQKLGESRRNIEEWERGAVLPSLTKVVKLADFFECSIDQLVGR